MENAAVFDFEIVGARLLGPAPIHDVWIRAERGVTALYGRNGAGKSRLLNAICALYDGDPDASGYIVAKPVLCPDGDGPIAVRIASRPKSYSAASLWELVAKYAWDDALSEIDLPDDALFDDEELDTHTWAEFDDLDDHDQARREDLTAFADHLEDDTDAEFDDLDRIGAEIARQGLVAFTPTLDGWNLSLAFMIDATTPGLAAARHQVKAGEQTMTVRSLCDIDGEVHRARLSVAEQVPYRSNAEIWARATPIGTHSVEVVRPGRQNFDQIRQHVIDRFRTSAVQPGNAGCDPDGLPPQWKQDLRRFNSTMETFLSQVLDRPPLLELELLEPTRWFTEAPLRWRVRDDNVEFGIDGLSEAHQKWASVAAAIADQDLPESPNWARKTLDRIAHLPTCRPWSIIGIDEPDAALHATAQRLAVDSLVTTAGRGRTSVIVSTHSREFLNHPDVDVLHVTRDTKNSVVCQRLSGADKQRQAEALGVSPADLLLLARGFVLVEGAHDVVVLGTLLGESFDAAGIRLLPMRGGSMLPSIVDSEFLAAMTDVPVIAVLDNLDAVAVQTFWDAVRAAPDLKDFDSLAKLLPEAGSSERKFLKNFAMTAFVYGRADRFHPYGLSAPDIQDYLPVEAFVPDAKSWHELRAEHKSEPKSMPMKKWLELRYGAAINEDSLSRACSMLDAIPEDLIALLEFCVEKVRDHPRR